MKHLLCASVNRVLEAYHDGELPVEEQIVVETHLSECYLCASEAKSLRMVRDALRDRRLEAPCGFVRDGSAYFLLSPRPFRDDPRAAVFLAWLRQEAAASLPGPEGAGPGADYSVAS